MTMGKNSDMYTPLKMKFSLSVVLLVLTVAVYANSFDNAFTNWDDDALVVNNPAIRSLAPDNISDIFQLLPGATYQPVRVLSYAIDYHFWKLNPLGYHIHSTLLHGMAGVFLFLALLLAIPQIRGWDRQLSAMQVCFTAFLTAMLFVVHPVNVEPVVWLSGRKYVLMSFFMFASFYLFIKSGQGGRFSRLWYAGSLVSWVLSALSSPVGVVVPGLFFLYEYCRDGAINPLTVFKKRWRALFFFLAMGLLVLGVLLSVLVFSETGGARMSQIHGKWGNTLMTMLRVLFDYFRNLFMPLWLNPRYPDFVHTSFWHVKILVTTIALMGLLVFLVRQIRMQGNKHTLFCAGWFIIAFLPMANIIPISTKMADRYIYIAGIGVMLWVVSVLVTGYGRLQPRPLRYVPATLISLMILGSVMLTVQRNRVWKDSYTLWKSSVETSPYNLLPNVNLGNVYFYRGEYEKALEHYQIALDIAPDHFAIHKNIGQAYAFMHRYQKALTHFLRHVELNSPSHDMMVQIARMYFALDQNDLAMDYYQKALTMRPDDPAIHYDLGRIFQEKNQFDKASFHFETALSLKPEYPEVYNCLGNLDLVQENYSQAMAAFEKALALDPDNPVVLYNMGNALALQGKLKDSLTYYEKSYAADPAYKKALDMINQITSHLESR
jgi:protein O-mannosyl-transferase